MSLRLTSILLGAALLACHGEEGRLRAQIAADYVTEMRAQGGAVWSRDVLTLHEDGRWVRTTTGQMGDHRIAGTDSGRYRVENRLLILRSAAHGGALVRYRVNGDTLHGANAVAVARATGVDIGPEGFLLRAR